MQPTELPNRVWSKLGMDIVGPIDGAPASARFAITLGGLPGSDAPVAEAVPQTTSPPPPSQDDLDWLGLETSYGIRDWDR